MKVLVTGANGFIGRALTETLVSAGRFQVLALVRCKTSFPDHVEQLVADLLDDIDWVPLLADVDVIVHLAGRAHVLNEKENDPQLIYRRINVEATRKLAQCAAEAGVKRFIFVSTIKVNGEHTNGRAPFKNNDAAKPVDPYSASKYEAELTLQGIARQRGMELVIIRPPLVYGPGVKGNFATMLDWLARGIPLPLGAINNRRSLLALDNFCDFISLCITHPDVGGHTLLVSDGEDLSTTELLQTLKEGMHAHTWLLPVPAGILEILAKLTGHKAKSDRLLGNLQVDPADTFKLTGWRPSKPARDALRETAAKYKSRSR
jgi:nucleoside-diphosphate-sugar epimerase